MGSELTTLALFLLLPAIMLGLSLHKTNWGLAAILALVVFFREGWHPDLVGTWTLYEIECCNVHIMEVLIAVLLGVVVLKRSRPGAPGADVWLPPYSGVLLIFLFLAGLAAFHGMLGSTHVREAFRYGEWRSTIAALLLLLLVPNILAHRADVHRLYHGLFGLAALRCLWGWLAYGLGGGARHVTLGYRVVFWDSGENILFCILIAATLAEGLIRRPRGRGFGWRAVAALLMAGSVLFSYRRSYWVFLGLACVTVIGFAPLKQKLRLAVAGMLAGIGLFTAINLGLAGERLETLIHRGQSFFTSRDTNQFHWFDIVDAFLTIRRQPWQGVGFGNHFTRVKTRDIPGVETIPTNYVHNSYLYIWLKMGLFGLLAFLVLLMIYTDDTLRGLRRLDNTADRALAVGLFSTLPGMLGIFFWGNDLFANTRNPVLFFVCLGMVTALIRRQIQSSAPSLSAGTQASLQ